MLVRKCYISMTYPSHHYTDPRCYPWSDPCQLEGSETGGGSSERSPSSQQQGKKRCAVGGNGEQESTVVKGSTKFERRSGCKQWCHSLHQLDSCCLFFCIICKDFPTLGYCLQKTEVSFGDVFATLPILYLWMSDNRTTFLVCVPFVWVEIIHYH